MAEKICGVYKITNTVTGDFYIGSSKDVKHRWAAHKWPSRWNDNPNNPMYNDMQKYGTDKFVFEILEEVEPDKLKEKEQEFIEMLQPNYNNYNAKGFDIERYKESQKEYQKSDKYKKSQKEYHKSDKYKEYQKEYQKSDKYKEYKEHKNKYNSQLCYYNDEILTLGALVTRFRRAGIPHPTAEAKKYLLNK